MNEKHSGVIKAIIKSEFGFIETKELNNDVYFNSRSLSPELNMNSLKVGMGVRFDLVETNQGSNAENLEVYDPLYDYFLDYALIAPNDKKLYDEFCDNALKYAEYLYDNKVTTSMIRNIYSRILGANNIMSLKMLRPQFAYTSGRNSENGGLQNFMQLLDEIVRKMEVEEGEKSDREMKNFKSFMEAIVAYRKFVGKDE